jgi:hypothetical protein
MAPLGQGRRSGFMAKSIRVKLDAVEVTAELRDTQTAEAIWEALPLRAEANTWGKEIYFRIPVALELEEGREIVDVGDLGYWPDGCAFCLFFGPTPASRGDEIRPASAVSVFGRVLEDATVLEEVPAGTPVVVERA